MKGIVSNVSFSILAYCSSSVCSADHDDNGDSCAIGITLYICLFFFCIWTSCYTRHIYTNIYLYICYLCGPIDVAFFIVADAALYSERLLQLYVLPDFIPFYRVMLSQQTNNFHIPTCFYVDAYIYIYIYICSNFWPMLFLTYRTCLYFRY